jgi:ectoine hydroxylase-related dioxygenase (phytanoyl-CoA dioxygenase family)
MAQRLTGSPSIRLYHDQALVKEPGPSAPSPWHQDQPYWPSAEPGMISCWMALDDVTVERGCMQFIPGSHQWGEFPPISFEGEGPELKDYVSEEQKAQWEPQPVELEAGSCTFHHGLTFHYTNANTTDHIRRALVAIFIPDGITYGPDEDMDNPFEDSITSDIGEPLRGSRFPELV